VQTTSKSMQNENANWWQHNEVMKMREVFDIKYLASWLSKITKQREFIFVTCILSQPITKNIYQIVVNVLWYKYTFFISTTSLLIAIETTKIYYNNPHKSADISYPQVQVFGFIIWNDLCYCFTGEITEMVSH